MEKKNRMAFNSFTEFVRLLERKGELRRVVVPVATELEITEVADREMKRANGGKAYMVAMVGSSDLKSGAVPGA